MEAYFRFNGSVLAVQMTIQVLFGNNFDGYTVIKDSQGYALSFGGELTDETLQQIVSDYQQMEADGYGGRTGKGQTGR